MIATDPRLKTILQRISRRPTLPLRDYVSEILKLHLRLPDTRPSGRAIASDRLKINADRSRIVHIKMTCLREMTTLSNVERKLRNHVESKYVNYLQNYKNRQARSAIVDSAMQPLSSRIADIKAAIEIMDVALGDYDARAFGIRDAVSALALAERE